jgi:hypothetical protein
LEVVLMLCGKESVILPVLFVMITWSAEPCVKVALVKVLPVVLPISNCPLVNVVCPVPPEATGNVPVVNSDVLVA